MIWSPWTYRGGVPMLRKDWRNPRQWNKTEAGKRVSHAEFVSARRLMICPTAFCDWLDNKVPDDWLARFLALVDETPNLERVLPTEWTADWESRMRAVVRMPASGHRGINLAYRWLREGTPPPNVVVAARVQTQRELDARVPFLLRIPGRRWLRLELRGSVDFAYTPRNLIDRVIVGGQTGPLAAPCNVEWIRDVVTQCRRVGTEVVVDRLGSWPVIGEARRFGIRHRDGARISEWPEDLRKYATTEVLS